MNTLLCAPLEQGACLSADDVEALRASSRPGWSIERRAGYFRAAGPHVTVEAITPLDLLTAIYTLAALEGEAWEMQRVCARAALERSKREGV